MKSPKILVGCPTTEAKKYALAAYLYTVNHLDYSNYDVLLVDNSQGSAYFNLLQRLGVNVLKSSWMKNPYDQETKARNLIREYAIEHDYDYFLSLESDVFPPKDIITNLLRHGKPFVTTIVYGHWIRGNKIKRLVGLCKESKHKPGRYYPLTEEELREADLIKVDRAHSSCTLIKTELLQKVEYRHDNYQYPDYCLSDDLRKLGYELYCDTRIPITHVTGGTTHARTNQWRKKNKKIKIDD